MALFQPNYTPVEQPSGSFTRVTHFTKMIDGIDDGLVENSFRSGNCRLVLKGDHQSRQGSSYGCVEFLNFWFPFH